MFISTIPMLHVPLSLPRPSLSASPLRVTGAHWVKGEKHIVCVHACVPASTQPLSSWDQILKPVHSRLEEPLREGKRDFMQLQGLQCKSQGTTLEPDSAHLSSINTEKPLQMLHNHCRVLFFVSFFFFFPLSYPAPGAIPCNKKASHDFDLVSFWEISAKMFHSEWIHLLGESLLGMSACL